MRKIDGSPKNLKQLLLNTKYSIHYYQREYMWRKEQIEELIEDLSSEFLNFYKQGDERVDVYHYGVYFMGSIVLAGKENAIIDGQQRLTSLTLLLMYLKNRLSKLNIVDHKLNSMVYSESYGIESFNINVEERDECMQAIYDGKPYDVTGQSASVKNLYARYLDIEEEFPQEINDDILLHFFDWLINNVMFIEIDASTEQDAHKIFVTMNDRGLRLTSVEMLKGYILSEIKDDKLRKQLNFIWKDQILKLKSLGEEKDNEDEVFFKNYLRAQFAETIRETKAGSENKDFDLIGTELHKWVRDEKNKLHLHSSADYELFVKKMVKYAEIYIKIKEAEKVFNKKMQYVYYNAQLGFTLQSQLLLSAISYEDNWDTIYEKINLVSRFVDLLIHSRVTRYRSVQYSTIKNYIFSVTKQIRNSTIADLKMKLMNLCNDEAFNPEQELKTLYLNNFTKKYIKHMLARVTGFIEESIGIENNYCSYVAINVKNPYEVEHILCDHYEWFDDEYLTKDEFWNYRNSVGSLLLLHKSINASLNDSKYEHKLIKYCSNEGNIYTESLGKVAYINNPQFINFIQNNNLPFKAYDKFGKEEIIERTTLFTELFKLVWNYKLFE